MNTTDEERQHLEIDFGPNDDYPITIEVPLGQEATIRLPEDELQNLWYPAR